MAHLQYVAIRSSSSLTGAMLQERRPPPPPWGRRTFFPHLSRCTQLHRAAVSSLTCAVVQERRPFLPRVAVFCFGGVFCRGRWAGAFASANRAARRPKPYPKVNAPAQTLTTGKSEQGLNSDQRRKTYSFRPKLRSLSKSAQISGFWQIQNGQFPAPSARLRHPRAPYAALTPPHAPDRSLRDCQRCARNFDGVADSFFAKSSPCH
mgnify:CR=1 FL=1